VIKLENTVFKDVASTVQADIVLAGRTWVVDQFSETAADNNPGSASHPLRTISAAAQVASAGDTVLIFPGVYRERVAPRRGGQVGRPIIYRANKPGTVIIKGSDVFTRDWKHDLECPEIVSTPCDSIVSAGNNPFLMGLRGLDRASRPVTGGELNPTRGQVFVNGEPYQQVLRAENLRAFEGTWLVDAAGRDLFIHFRKSDLTGDAEPLVEVSTRHRIFAPHERYLGHIHLIGLVFEHCANNHPTPQVGAVSTRSGHHWLIEDCTIRHAHTIGLDIGSEWGIEETNESGDTRNGVVEHNESERTGVGYHLVRGNTISDNGLCGICGLKSWGTRIVGNTLERNNFLGFRTWEVAGIKMHLFFDGVIEGNFLRDNDCFGIWLDNQYRGSRVTRNIILNSHMAGINIEMGLGPVLIDNNIVAYTRAGDGLYSHDASGVTIAHNLFYGNANYGVYMAVATDRHASDGLPMRCSNNRVLNNMIFGNKVGAISMPFPWERATHNISDYNLIMGAGETMDESTGVEEPLFRINTSHKHVPQATITEAVAQRLGAAGLGYAPAQVWETNPVLTLGQWQVASGHDTGSRTTVMYHDMLGTRTCFLRFVLSESINDFQVPRVEGVDRDFFAQQYAGSAMVSPGPFLHLCGGVLEVPLVCQIARFPLKAVSASTDTDQKRVDFASTGL